MRLNQIIYLSVILFMAGCSENSENTSSSESAKLQLGYEKMVLDNGLEVVFHQDKSDPVVAVALTFHVGSAREQPGKTGFAHLFEHLYFLDSENLGRGGLDKMSSRIGGSGANGSTSRDRTNYFQTVPKDALEKMIWAEADKVGYFINTVTESVLAKEKQVVKNEKRQSVDNRPYGHTNYVIVNNLYPEGHPYNWEVIGTLEDLQQSSLADVKEFHSRYYGPNNATLVIAGDFDLEQAKAWVHKYFDEIPATAPVEPLEKMPVELVETKKLYYEDNFARLPELQMVWPTVPAYHEDSYALDILASLLTEGKSSPFYEVLVKEKQLTSNVSMFSYTSELAGEQRLTVRAYPDVDLDSVMAAVNMAFERFENEGFSDADLERIKAVIETSYYTQLSSVLGKAFQLAQYNIFAGDPGFINDEIQLTLDVKAEDVMNVYEKYIKGRDFIATSFVPDGRPELAVAGSVEAEVIEEEFVENGEGEDFELPELAEYEKTPSGFDRSVEPPFGESPDITVPEVWSAELSNGMSVKGIVNDELPLVQFNILIDGGMLVEDPSKIGVSNLLGEMLTKGTANRTAVELEEAIDALGASISVRSGTEHITIQGNVLSRNYAELINLLEEILLQPRWDSTEFLLAKQQVISEIEQAKANPLALSSDVFRKIVYGKSILSNNSSGSVESVSNITMDDLRDYYEKYIVPNVSRMHVVGSLNQQQIISALDSLAVNWKEKSVQIRQPSLPIEPESSRVYFYDVPGAKQSALRFGYLAMAETHPDYYPAVVMNYKLGGGGFASRFTQELREGKGYTYGIRSGFNGSALPGPFLISSGVRTNVTYESSALIKDILEKYPETFTDQDLENTKSYFLKSNARAFETFGAKLDMLEKLSGYGWSPEYVKEREEIVKNMTIQEIRNLASEYAAPDKMIYIIVGDAATQLDKLKELGYGEPVLIRDLESYEVQ